MRGRELKASYDIAIVGSGFAGSLLAMIARRAGRSVVLIERGRHPRFAIGESTVPLGNLLIEEIAVEYDLPRLRPLCKWGTWQQSYPQLACGLKRGFSFYHHGGGSAFSREEQLLVTASANDRTSDTHWYRSELDTFLVSEAQNLGVNYFDHIDLTGMEQRSDEVELIGERDGDPVAFRAKFLIDASGPRGFVHHALGLQEAWYPDYPQTEALYSHFTDVDRFESSKDIATPPYPPDDAALHHVFEGGWIWVLRFNNGVTSAGAAVTAAVANRFGFADRGAGWTRLLDCLPAVKKQFSSARAQLPFVHAPRLAFLSEKLAGARWAMLPSAGGFVDPLLSTGFPLTLLGVMRLGALIHEDWGKKRFHERLSCYALKTGREATATARLIGAMYAAMGNFPLFVSLSMLYFVAASYSERSRREKHRPAPSFLLCDDPAFGPASARFCEQARCAKAGRQSADLSAEILRSIAPFNTARFGDLELRNWYPAD